MTTTTSPQAISRILNAAGITRSELRRGRICMMASEGFEVTKDYYGTIVVDYRNRTSSMLSYADFQSKKEAALTKINEVLTAKGYAVVPGPHGFIVRKAGK